MKKIKFLTLITLMSFSLLAANDRDKKANDKIIIDITKIELSENGIIESVDFVSGTCSEKRDGVTYSTTVGCFLCGKKRAEERCKRKLSEKVDKLNPQRD